VFWGEGSPADRKTSTQVEKHGPKKPKCDRKQKIKLARESARMGGIDGGRRTNIVVRKLKRVVVGSEGRKETQKKMVSTKEKKLPKKKQSPENL